MDVRADADRQELIALMARAAAGDRSAFAEIYQLTSAKLFGIAHRILRDEAASRDVLQEAYVKIWQRIGDFDAASGSPITWMGIIVRNRALDELRRRRPMDSLTREDDTESDIAAQTEDPLAGRERSEALRRLLACLGGLEDTRRQVVLLAYYRGLSREDLARRFDRPVPTIKTWLHRSLAQLRGCLEP